MNKPKLLKQTQLYQNQWCEIVQDEVQISDDFEINYTYVKRNDGAVGVVINDSNEILLVKQYRPPTQSFTWELPGGGTDEGEDHKTALIREVKEEAGVVIEIIESWGESYPMPSIASEKSFLFLAKTSASIPEKDHGEPDELIEDVRFIPLDEALEMIESGEIIDSYTIMGLLRFAYNNFQI